MIERQIKNRDLLSLKDQIAYDIGTNEARAARYQVVHA